MTARAISRRSFRGRFSASSPERSGVLLGNTEENEYSMGPALYDPIEVSASLRDSGAFASDGRECCRRLGSADFGMGDKLIDGTADNKTLTAGGFALMPAGVKHFAFTTDQETTIVFYGEGPVEFKYVNPADDPRKAHAVK